MWHNFRVLAALALTLTCAFLTFAQTDPPLDAEAKPPQVLHPITVIVLDDQGQPMTEGELQIIAFSRLPAFTIEQRRQLQEQQRAGLILRGREAPEQSSSTFRLDGSASYTFTPESAYNRLIIRVNSDGYVRRSNAYPPPEEPLTKTIRLEKGYTMGGVIVDDQGQPLADQFISIIRATSETRWVSVASGKTDSQGRWEIESLPAGQPLGIDISNNEVERRYADIPRDVLSNFEALKRGEHRLVLQRARMLKLQAIDTEGQPTSNVSFSVTRSEHDRYETRRAEENTILIYQLPDQPVEVTVRPQDSDAYLEDTIMLTPQFEDELETYIYRLKPKAPLLVRVLDSQNKPLHSIYVGVHSSSFPDRTIDRSVYWEGDYTDMEGKMTLEGLPATGEVVIDVSNSSVHMGRYTLPLGTGKVQTIKLSDKGYSPWTVTVRDESGNPRPHIPVRFNTFSGRSQEGATVEDLNLMTDENGRAQWTPTKPHGSIKIHAQYYNPMEPEYCIMAASYDASRNSHEDVDITLRQGDLIGGRVIDELGNPATNVRINLYDHREHHGQSPFVHQCFHRFAVTDQEGVWSYGPVDPDSTVRLVMQDDRYNATHYRIVPPRSDLLARTHELVVNRARIIRVKVVTESGEPIRQAQLRLHVTGRDEFVQNPEYQLIDEDSGNTVTFTGLEDQSYTIRGESFMDEFAPTEKAFTPQFPDEAETHTLVLSAPPSVTIQILDARGMPLPNVSISIELDPRDQKDVQIQNFTPFLHTDQNGNAELRNPPLVDKVRIRILHPPYLDQQFEIPLDKPINILQLPDLQLMEQEPRRLAPI